MKRGANTDEMMPRRVSELVLPAEIRQILSSSGIGIGTRGQAGRVDVESVTVYGWVLSVEAPDSTWSRSADQDTRRKVAELANQAGYKTEVSNKVTVAFPHAPAATDDLEWEDEQWLRVRGLL